MKKTNQQIKTEVVNYLTKTSNHLFIKPNGEYFKIEIKDSSFYKNENGKEEIINIDNSINWYSENTKCVIKHQLFLDKKMVAIKKNSI